MGLPFEGVTPSADRRAAPTARPSRAGTELPISRKPFHFVTWNRNQSGYP